MAPDFLKNHYPTYTAIGLDPDAAVTETNSGRLEAMVDQFSAVIDGSEDVSNNATFSVVPPTRIAADAPIMDALVALLE